MKHFLLRSRYERIIFFSSLVVTGLFIVAYIISGNASLPFVNIESDRYTPLAVSLYERGTFTFSTSSPYVLEGAHVPGYPFFLALIAVPFGSVIPALLLQMFLFACTGVLLYRLFEGAFSERVCFFGSLLFVVEPFTAFTVARPLSEALFLFLLISGLYIGRCAIEKHDFKLFFFSAFLFAAATLTRPILFYILPFILLVTVIFVYRKSPRHALYVFLASALGALVLLAPWAYRNHEAFGTWMLSTKGAYTLYFYDAALLLQYREGISGLEANTRLFNLARAEYPEVRTADDLRSPKYNAFMTRESIAIIRMAPIQFAQMYFASIATFFLSDGYRLLWYEFSGGDISLPNITKAIVTGHIDVVVSYVHEHSVQAFFLLSGLLFWGSVFMLSSIAVISACLRPSRARLLIFMLVFVIVYFAILTGPVAQARYRIVVTPFLFMLAAYGASILLPMIRRRYEQYVI